MIKHQLPYQDENGVVYDNKVKYYSDKGFKIKQIETGEIFDSVVDPYPSKYSYNETDVLVEDLSIMEEKAKAYDIIMGVSE